MSIQYQKKAKRYARALFEALAPIDLDLALNEVSLLSTILENHEILAQALKNPAYPLDQRMKALQQVMIQAGLTLPSVKNMILLLLENRSLPVLKPLEIQFRELVLNFKKTIAVKIQSAHAVSEEEIAKLKGSILQKMGLVIDVETSIDKTLIGGAVIVVGDKILDRSISGALNSAMRELVG